MAGEVVGDGAGDGRSTGDGESSGSACWSASAIASSPAAFGCSGAGSDGPCTHGSVVQSSCPVNLGTATPKPNRPAPWASTVFSWPSRASSTFTFTGVMSYWCRQPTLDPKGE